MLRRDHRRAVRALPLGLLAVAAGCNPPPPANMPPPIPAAELTGLPRVAFSEIVEAAGAPVVKTGPVAKGEALVTVPYRYRHTAVLTEDVRGHSFTVRGVQAPAGSPGYYAGRFSTSRLPEEGAPLDMWCFLPQAAGGRRETICLLRDLPGLAAIAPTGDNPWLWDRFSPATGTFDYVRTPIFERRRVDLPVDLVLDYRFDGWRGDQLWVEIHAVGRHVMDLAVPRDASGRFVLPTIAGSYVIARDPADPAAARVTAAGG